MDAGGRQDEPPWAAQVVLSVTGVPKSDRAAIQELVERAGARYSPSLSRRCTHLVMPARVNERSEKLLSALRNRHKWGLHIVDLRWVLESAQAGQRLEEERFPVHPLLQEQAVPGSPAGKPAASWAGSGGMPSEQAADTDRQPQGQAGLQPAALAAAAAPAASPTDPLRHSINSRPLSSFAACQPAPSLQTQAPSAGRSERLQVSDGSPTQWGASSGAAAALHSAAAAVLPGQVEQRRLMQQQADEEVDFSKLPMTQAGFIPGADLLEQLRASTAGLLHAESAQQPAQAAPQSAQQQQQQRQQQSAEHMYQQQHGRSPAGWQPQRLPVPRYASQGSPAQPGQSSTEVVAPTTSLSPSVPPSVAARQGGAATTSTADLLQQLRLSAAGPQQPAQQQQQPAPTQLVADLLEQVVRSSTSALQSAQPLEACEQRQQPQQRQQQQQQPAIRTDDFLQQLRSSAVKAHIQQPALQVQQEQQPRPQPAGRRLATEALLAALRATPAAGLTPLQRLAEAQPAGQVGATATSDLVLQLQQAASARAAPDQHIGQPQLQAGQVSTGKKPQQQVEQTAPATADLLQQLQAARVPHAAGPEQRSRQAAPSTAELLQQLHASGDVPSMSSLLPAQQAQPGAASVTATRQAGAAAAPDGGDLAGLPQRAQWPTVAAPLPQQVSLPAAAGVPLVQAEVAAAAASRLADQMRSLLQEARPAAGLLTTGAMEATAAERPGAGSSMSTDKLLALLRQQQEQRHSSLVPPAASPMADGGAAELLSRLRSTAPQASFTPLRPQVQAAAAQPAQPRVVGPRVQQAARWGTGGPASEDQEVRPAKYQRQSEADGRVPAACGTLPPAQQAATIPPGTPAAEVAAEAADEGCSSLAHTALVSGGPLEGTLSPSGSVPASSAGSPPLARPSTGAPAAPGLADAVSPAGSGSGSGKADAAASQVAESCRVFGGMLAIVDPSLPAEEQQRVGMALEQGGGHVAAGGGLARGVTHVVCPPEQALKWLSMGVGIVSPAWVLQSLRTGKQQRCLVVSADASRHLPAPPAATRGSGQSPGSSEAGCGTGSSGRRASIQQLSGDLLTSKDARQQALMRLAGEGAAAAACAGAGTPGGPGPRLAGGHRPAATPAELLVGVLWSVLQPPHTAQLEARCQARVAQEDEEPTVIPDSEDEEGEQAGCCASASQAAVADVLREAAEACQPDEGSSGADTAAAWQQDVVLQGPATITLLLPRDARGELGSDTRCFTVPSSSQGRELTAALLLGCVHAYYAEELPPAEQLQLLQAHPAAEGAAAVLRPAFLELGALERGTLLGPRSAFEGLRKATRDPAGAVYEVLLGS